jgi:GMP synthase-like glutamine amidotransferase
MANPRKSLKKTRSIAYNLQQGRCYYCDQPMWSKQPGELVSQYDLTLKQARYFQCTGEHLEAHSQGGRVAQSNIVAACRFCNQTRHKRKNPLDPIQYKNMVYSRMDKGRWHVARLM